MSNAIPADRIQLVEAAPKPFAALLRMEQSLDLPERLHNLVSLRASQINGCAFCLDMHWKDARAAGETEERLYMLGAWRESPLYDERERAALALCEAMTVINEGHVPGEVWERAKAVFDQPELANLVFAITAINSWNRLNITARVEPGHYDPSQRAMLGRAA
jgi:AhpD family alkylhydroperoxidase